MPKLACKASNPGIQENASKAYALALGDLGTSNPIIEGAAIWDHGLECKYMGAGNAGIQSKAFKLYFTLCTPGSGTLPEAK